jgi:acetyl-CoA carboxylase biotin carboxyl carrier protein
MSETPSEPSRFPEVEIVRQLARLMQKYDMTAIDFGEGPNKIRLRRQGVMTSFVPAVGAAVTAASGANQPAPKQEPAPPPVKPSGLLIESPMVGTFFASPAPDAPAFIEVGSFVNEKTTVCVIEAMKVFTDIPAGVSGTITEILAKNGQPVEFGQPLFRVSQE